MTFIDVLAEYFDVSSAKVRIEVIHLERATERRPHIEALRQIVGPELVVRPAADGKALQVAGHPMICASGSNKSRSPGEMGCLVSHIEAARAALATDAEYLVLFEDDCIPSPTYSLGRLKAWLHALKLFRGKFQPAGAAHFLLLSTRGCYTEKMLTTTISTTNHFNGTHAYVMSRQLMQLFIGSYEHLLQKGVTYPADGLLGLLLHAKEWWALKPRMDTLFFQQSLSTPSHIEGTGGDSSIPLARK